MYFSKHNRIFSFTVAVFLIASEPIFGRIVIPINSQEDFDGLPKRISEIVKTGENEIVFSFVPRTYILKEKGFTLKGINESSLSIRFMGNGAILIPEGREYQHGDIYEGDYSPNNSWMHGSMDIESWTHARYSEGLVEVLDESAHKCRIRTTEFYSKNNDFSRAYILIPHWYQSSICKIDRIDGQYIYFTASDLKRSARGGGDYNLNDDNNFGKKGRVRYKLCNIETGDDYLRIIDGKVFLPNSIKTVWEGRASHLIAFTNCHFARIEFQDLSFYGGSNVNTISAIGLKNVTCDSFLFRGCEFNGIRSNIIVSESVDNIRIENCRFVDCYLTGLRTDNNCKNTSLINNSFISMGKFMTNSFCMILRGNNYYASDNTITNFGYGGIGVGVWYGTKKENPCKGVVENNILSYTKDYMSDIENHGMMDSGAIYVWTKNDGCVIRNNYINGYSGMKENRGIFCDDGAMNFELYGNVIVGIRNGYCIDSWRNSKVEDRITPGTGIQRSNVNISIHDNIVDGCIRFVGNDVDNNGCLFSNNYILITEGQVCPKHILSNVVTDGNEIVLTNVGEKRGRTSITRKSYRQIKKNSSLKKMRSFFRKD